MGVGTSIGAYPQRRNIFSVSEMINWQSFLSKGRGLEVFYPIHAMMWLAWSRAGTGSYCEAMSVTTLSFLEDSIHSTPLPALTFFFTLFSMLFPVLGGLGDVVSLFRDEHHTQLFLCGCWRSKLKILCCAANLLTGPRPALLILLCCVSISGTEWI